MGQQGGKSFLEQLKEWFWSWFQPTAVKEKKEKETCKHDPNPTKIEKLKPGDGYNHKTAADNCRFLYYTVPKGTISNSTSPTPVVNNYHNDNLLTGVLLGHMMSSHTHEVEPATPVEVAPETRSYEEVASPRAVETTTSYEAAPEPREVYVAPEPRAVETPSYESSYSAPSDNSSSDYSSPSYDSGSSSYDSGSSGGGGDW
jgi:hypothetical protein